MVSAAHQYTEVLIFVSLPIYLSITITYHALWFPQVTDMPSITYDVYGDEEAIEELYGPRSWVGPALASAIFCFLPTGLIAFYNAKQVRHSCLILQWF